MFISRTIHIKRLTAAQKERLRLLISASGRLYSAAVADAKKNPRRDVRTATGILKAHEAAAVLGSGYVYGIIKAAHGDILKYTNTVKKSQRYGYSAFLEGEHFKNVQPPSSRTVFPLYCERVKQQDGRISVPNTDIYVPLYKGIEDVTVKRFVLYERSGDFYMVVVFEQAEPKKASTDRRKALGIDLGVTNFATVVDSDGRSFILDGRYLKHLIYCYTVQMKQIKKANAATKRESKVIRDRKERMNAYLNRCTHYIVEYCKAHRIGNVVVGHSSDFNNYSTLGDNSLMFGYMPYSAFCKKLEFECRKYGIAFFRQDESYTSQASFLDGDYMPERMTQSKLEFSGKRIKRGLYCSKDGRTLNADVNGAANILRKFYDYTFPSVSGNAVPPDLGTLGDRGIAQPMRLNLRNALDFS